MTITKRLRCAACDHIATIQRRKSKDRPAGHVKHLWCPLCKARRPHIELNEFEVEFESNWTSSSTGGSAHG